MEENLKSVSEDVTLAKDLTIGLSFLICSAGGLPIVLLKGLWSCLIPSLTLLQTPA